MKIITNNQKIKRNKRIGQIINYASLAILGITAVLLYYSLTTTNNFALQNYSLIGVIAAYLITQVSLYYGNRWVRSPRPDEQLTASLKGLEDKYTLYHYKTSVPHLLIGPAGIWVLIPYYQAGTITYDEKKGRWKQKGGNWYLKIFGQENISRPDLEVKNYVEDVMQMIHGLFKDDEQTLSRFIKDDETPIVQAALIFTNPKAIIQAPDAPSATMSIDKLKDFIRKKAREKGVPMEAIVALEEHLPYE
jgi:hypothetical protein